MSNAHTIDEARLGIMLNELRLPTIKTLWPQFAEQADREGWPAARFLSAIAEHELAERAHRRIERHLAEAHLPPGKTLDSFAFDAVPMVSKAQVMAMTAGDSWLAKGANILLFGPPGGGKSHLAAAIGLALIENGWRVQFARTTDLVQKLQIARRDLELESAIAKLDKFDLLILDDLAYVTKDQAETSVLFELICARYERRSIMITANQPFGEWNRIFPDPAMTLAAVDRLVHHATIFEMNVESYRRRSAMEAKRQRGRPASYATIKNTHELVAERQSEIDEGLASDDPDCRAIDAVALEITDDRPVALSLAPGPVIDADHARGLWRLEVGRSDHPQQGIAADRHGQLARQTRARLAAGRKADRQLAFAEAGGASGLRSHRFRQSLGEDPLRALRIHASKPPCVKLNLDNPPMPRQIGEPAHVMAVDAACSATAGWTTRFRRLRSGNKHHLLSLRENLDDGNFGQNQRAE